MEIIFSREAAEGLRDRYTVLELETFDVEGQKLETFCVVPAEKLLYEMSDLEHNSQLHAQLVQAIKDQDAALCTDLTDVLKGRFGGELDSFYEIIHDRFAVEQ